MTSSHLAGLDQLAGLTGSQVSGSGVILATYQAAASAAAPDAEWT